MATIDTRVVEMKFENHLFERNVRTTMNTLDKLKESLNFKGATKSLEEVEQTASSIDLSSLERSVNSLQSRFSTFGIVGMTVIQNLTNSAMKLGSTLVNNVLAPIKTGGWNRATNLDKAKFQIEGLGEKWEEVEPDISYGVDATAYGLDAAATAASQLIASGVEFGKTFGETGSSPMAKALRGISGVAAMTSSTYEEISSIFTTVAGQGKLMTMQLRQLESRGLNAAAQMGKVLGKTEEEIREMVTEGQIDFATFSEAMDDAFGEHAKKANETFEGALANMKSALSRIGAEFAGPIRSNMIPIFNALREVFNDIKKVRLTPLYADFADFAAKASNVVAHLINGAKSFLPLIDEVVKRIDLLYHKFDDFMSKVTPFWKKTSDEAEEAADTITEAVDEIADAANRVIAGEFGNGDERREALEAAGFSYEQVQNAVNELLGDTTRYDVELENSEKKIKKTTSALDRMNKRLESQDQFAKKSETGGIFGIFGGIGKSIQNLMPILTVAENLIKSIYNGLKGPVISIGNSVVSIITDITEAVGRVATKLNQILTQSGAYETISNFFTGALGVVSGIFEKIAGFIADITSGKGPLEATIDAFSGLINSDGIGTFTDFLGILASNIAKVSQDVGTNAIKTLVSFFGAFIESLINALPSIIKAAPLLLSIGKTLRTLSTLIKPVAAVFETIGAVPKVLQGLANNLDAEALLKVGAAILVVAGALALLSMVKWDKLIVGAGGIAVVTAALGTLFTLLNKASIVGINLTNLKETIENVIGGIMTAINTKNNADALLKMAFAFGVLSASMFLLAQLSWDKIARGAVAIAAVTGALVLLMFTVRKFTFAGVQKNPLTAFSQQITNIGTAISNTLGKLGTAALIASLTAAIVAITGAVLLLIGVPWKDGLKACAFLGIILGELMISLAIIKQIGGGVGGVGYAVFIVALSSIVSSMGKTIKTLSEVSWDDGIRGIVLMGLLLGELLGTLAIIKKMGGDVGSFKLGIFMGILALVVKSLSSTIVELSSINFLAGLGAVTLLGILLLELYGALQLFSKLSGDVVGFKTTLFMGALTLIVGSLSKTLVRLSEVPFASGLKALALMGGLFLEMAAITKLASKVNTGDGFTNLLTLAGFSIAFVVIASVVKSLSKISAFDIAKALVAIGGISAIMIGLTTQLNKLSGNITSGAHLLLTILPMLAILTTVCISLFFIAGFPADRLLAAGATVSMIMGTLMGFVAVMNKFGVPNIGAAGLTLLTIGGLLAEITVMFYVLEKIDSKKMITIANSVSELMAALSLISAATGLLGMGGGVTAVLSLDALLANIIAIEAVAAFVNDKFPSFKKFLKKGAPLLKTIGETIGTLFGGFLSKAIFEPLAESFGVMGESLNAFITNITPFLTGAENVSGYDTTALDTLGTLMTKVGNLGWTSFISSIKAAFADDDGMEAPLTSLTTFVTNFTTFASGITQISDDAVTKLETIKTVMTNLGTIGWESFKTSVLSHFTAKSDLAAAVTRVGTFATNIAGLGTSLSGITDDVDIPGKLDTVKTIVEKLGDTTWSSFIASAITNFTGKKSFTKVTESMGTFAENMATYAAKIADIDMDAVTASGNAMDIITKFANEVPNSGGFLSFFTGDNDIESFGKKLVSFGVYVNSYAKTVGGTDFTDAITATTAINDLNDIFVKIMDEGGIADANWLGEKLGEISSAITTLFADIANEVGANNAKSSLVEAGQNMFNYLAEGFVSVGNEADTGGVSAATRKVVDALMEGLKGETVLTELTAQAENIIIDIVDAMESALDTDTSVQTSMTTLISGVIDQTETDVKDGLENVITAVTTKLDDMTSTIEGYKDDFSTAIATAVSEMETKANSYVSNFETVGKNLVQGLANGIANNQSLALTAASNAAAEALKAAKKELDVKSPSRKFMEVGDYAMQGFALGIIQNAGLVNRSSAKSAGEALSGMTTVVSDFKAGSEEAMRSVLATIIGAWSYITSMIDENMSYSPTITPVLDLSNVQQGMNGFQSLMGTGYHFGALGVPSLTPHTSGQEKSGDIYNQAAIVNAIRGVQDDITRLGEEMSKMQVMMNTGQVVGAITTGVDRQLGNIQKYNARWA